MFVKDLSQWKQDALTYWTNVITASPYDNKSAMISDLNSKINSLTTNPYYNSTTLFNKTKDALFSLVCHVNVKYSTIYQNAPPITYSLGVSGLKDWYGAFSTSLPSVESVFNISVSATNPLAGTYGYSGISGYWTGFCPEGVDECPYSGWSGSSGYSGWSGYIVSGFSGAGDTGEGGSGSGYSGYFESAYDGFINWNDNVQTLINNCVTADTSRIDNFVNNASDGQRDNFLYRIFTTDEPKSVNISTKDYILYNLYFNEVLNLFNWQIKGLNS